MSDRRRALPSVDRLLRLGAVASLIERHGREPVVRATRDAVQQARGNGPAPTSDDAWTAAIAASLQQMSPTTLRRCINATGVVLHTNLGRAPLAAAAVEAVRDVAGGYSSLEYDVGKGARGDRHVHCAALLTSLTGAEDALVVNNAAAALVLSIAAAATGGDVVVSRGELVEIGGGFRIPEIMELGGARLREVGTTNRTRLADYARVTGAAALLKVHQSNFRVTGFTAEVPLAELVALGRKRRIPVLYDLGSGLMHPLGGELDGEPTIPDGVRAGAHAVIASGDKLLGGPQAGIIVGRAKFVAACRRHPFARAARADKMTLGALAATLAIHASPERARREIPVLRMLTAPVTGLAARAEALAALMPAEARAGVISTRSAAGGGSFPGVTVESRAVALMPDNVSAAELAKKLRAGRVPVVTIVNEGRVVIDVRSLMPGDDDVVAAAVREALA